MSSYPIHLYSLAIKPRYRGLVVLVSKACLEMKKAPAGETSRQVWPYYGARRGEEWPHH